MKRNRCRNTLETNKVIFARAFVFRAIQILRFDYRYPLPRLSAGISTAPKPADNRGRARTVLPYTIRAKTKAVDWGDRPRPLAETGHPALPVMISKVVK